MNKEQLLKVIDDLNFPKEEYYILSSGCLVLYGLRKQANDLDLWVSKELFADIVEKFYIDLELKNESGFYKLNELIEVVVNDKSEFNRDFKNDYPVEKLKSILDYKITRNAPKDQSDILNIKTYLNNIES